VLFSGQAAVPGLVAEQSITIVIVLLVANPGPTRRFVGNERTRCAVPVGS
jgi:hypothetical protein